MLQSTDYGSIASQALSAAFDPFDSVEVCRDEETEAYRPTEILT